MVGVVSPDDKRGRALIEAARRVGTRVTWVPWREALDDPGAVGRAGGPGERLRIDSPGADVGTWERLSGAHTEPGEWRPGRAWFAGLSRVIAAIRASSAHLEETHPDALGMTDKAECQARLAAAGVPVPPAFVAPASPPELFERLSNEGWGRAFVKPRWGSSGAGVLALERGKGWRITTTVSIRDGRLRNNKHLHRYDDPTQIDLLLRTVLADGALVQRWIPKAGTGGGPFDPPRETDRPAFPGLPHHPAVRAARAAWVAA